MFQRKVLLLAASAFAIGATIPGVSMADSMSSRKAAAAEYEKVVPVEEIVGDMLESYQNNPQLNMSESDVEDIRQAYDFAELREGMINTMAEHFTTAEIEALVAFYQQPAAQSAMEKMPEFMNSFIPMVQKPVMDHMQEMMRDKMGQQPGQGQ